MNVLDIDGYPIIRIDQIASLDTPSLRQAQQDASTLLQELRADGQPSPLVSSGSTPSRHHGHPTLTDNTQH